MKAIAGLVNKLWNRGVNNNDNDNGDYDGEDFTKLMREYGCSQIFPELSYFLLCFCIVECGGEREKRFTVRGIGRIQLADDCVLITYAKKYDNKKYLQAIDDRYRLCKTENDFKKYAKEIKLQFQFFKMSAYGDWFELKGRATASATVWIKKNLREAISREESSRRANGVPRTINIPASTTEESILTEPTIAQERDDDRKKRKIIAQNARRKKQKTNITAPKKNVPTPTIVVPPATPNNNTIGPAAANPEATLTENTPTAIAATDAKRLERERAARAKVSDALFKRQLGRYFDGYERLKYMRQQLKEKRQFGRKAAPIITAVAAPTYALITENPTPPADTNTVTPVTHVRPKQCAAKENCKSPGTSLQEFDNVCSFCNVRYHSACGEGGFCLLCNNSKLPARSTTTEDRNPNLETETETESSNLFIQCGSDVVDDNNLNRGSHNTENGGSTSVVATAIASETSSAVTETEVAINSTTLTHMDYGTLRKLAIKELGLTGKKKPKVFYAKKLAEHYGITLSPADSLRLKNKTKRSVRTQATSYVQVKDEVASRKTTVCLENVAELQHCTKYDYDPEKFLPCMLIFDALVDRPDKVVDGNFVRLDDEVKPTILVQNDTDVNVLIKNLETTVRKLKENPETVLRTSPQECFRTT